MKRSIGAIALLAGALGGCQTTGHKISDLVPGSRPDRVVATLGKPDMKWTDGQFEIYIYRRRRGHFSARRLDYSMIFEQGRLVEFGPGAVTQKGPDDVAIVPPGQKIR